MSTAPTKRTDTATEGSGVAGSQTATILGIPPAVAVFGTFLCAFVLIGHDLFSHHDLFTAHRLLLMGYVVAGSAVWFLVAAVVGTVSLLTRDRVGLRQALKGGFKSAGEPMVLAYAVLEPFLVLASAF